MDYFRDPFDERRLRALIKKTGLEPRALLRTNEALYRELELGKRDLSDDELIALMAAHPQLIQRPIVERGDRAVLARPVENLRALLDRE